jgi:hypothetical protein
MNEIDRKQADRRTLHFDSLDDALAEAERLAGSDVTTTANRSYGQILEHLARTFDVVTGHTAGVTVPLPLRWIMRVARPWVLARPMKPGFNLPSNAQSVFWPSDDVSVAEGMAHFRESLERFRQADSLPKHPLFGKMTRQQHDQLQCRHCELHLSFVHPQTQGT